MDFAISTRKILIIVIFLMSVLALCAAFGLGWILHAEPVSAGGGCKSLPLRLNTNQLVKPLLVCDMSFNKGKKLMAPLSSKLQSIIDAAKKQNNVSDASVFFQDFNTDDRVDINENSKFYPASLNRVALMIALLKIMESKPDSVPQGMVYNGADENSGQEILPKCALQKGEYYTIDQILETLIKCSDNNAFYLLTSSIDNSILQDLYNDLGISVDLLNPDQPKDYDFMNTEDASYFFRILYNASYLTDNNSEKTLELLSQTDFTQGIVAGVPKKIKVAHKFGLATFVNPDNQLVERELHDCGIVYHSKNPYLLCVMTKSSAPIANIENVIKDVSTAAYQFENSR